MEQFCGRLVADSLQTQFPLAPCVTGTVKFASLAGSHTNQVLRLFLANVKDWSEDALKKHDPEFHHAVTHGMEWTVLSADLLRSFPTMAQLVQESSNTGGQLQRREGEMQMARKVYNMWSSLSSDGKQAVRYMDIKDISFVFFSVFSFLSSNRLKMKGEAAAQQAGLCGLHAVHLHVPATVWRRPESGQLLGDRALGEVQLPEWQGLGGILLGPAFS